MHANLRLLKESKKLINETSNILRVEKVIESSGINNAHSDEAIKSKCDCISESVLPGTIQPAIIPEVPQKTVFDFSGKTVLIVDDVAFNLSLLEMFFKNTGAQLLFASNGREAVDTCISNHEVDAVLMDIQMPVMNGLEATREILKLKAGMPVIAITAFVHADDRQRCTDAGCIEFLPKPCNRFELLRLVNKYF